MEAPYVDVIPFTKFPESAIRAPSNVAAPVGSILTLSVSSTDPNVKENPLPKLARIDPDFVITASLPSNPPSLICSTKGSAEPAPQK